MLIQEYLKSGKSLKDLKHDWDIDHFVAVDIPVVAVHYYTWTNMQNPIARECRCTFLELNSWDVVGRSMDAFFNYFEPLGQETLSQIDWSSARAYEKRDGALVCLYHYLGEWRIGLRMSPDGSDLAVGINSPPSKLKWTELFKMALDHMGFTWTAFTSLLDKDIFYSFELCSPENRVGVVYTERSLTLISARYRNTHQEIHMEDMDLPFPKPDSHVVKSHDDVLELLATLMDPLACEGVVVCDAQFRRVKYVSPAYVKMMGASETESEEETLRRLLGRAFIPPSSPQDDVTAFDINDTSLHHTDATPYSQYVEGSSMMSTMLGRILKVGKAAKDQHNSVQAFSDSELIWPEAQDALKAGTSMSEYLDSLSEQEILKVLSKYETKIAPKNLNDQ